MSNKQVIEIIDEMIYWMSICNEEWEPQEEYYSEWQIALKKAKSRIQSLQDTDEWISVEERLPEEWKYVLVYWYDYHDVCFHKWDWIFYDWDFYDNLKPTHWQPLPELPNIS